MVTRKKEEVAPSTPTKALTETAKKELLDAAIEQSSRNLSTSFIETGNIGFDLAVTNGQGLPEGSSILLWAVAGVGKTTVVGDICKRVLDAAKQREEEYKILYIAVENSKELLKAMGLGPYMASKELLYIAKQVNWRTVELYYDAIIKGYKEFKGVKMVIIDSVNNVLSDSNIEKSGADGDFGTRAKERGNFYAKYFPLCSEKGITTILISQARNKQAASQYEDPNRAAVTNVDLHNVEVIFKCTKKSLTTTDGQVVIKTAFGDVKEQKRYVLKLDSSTQNCKNRFFKGLPVELLVVKGCGVDNTYSLRKLLEFYGYIKQKSGWFTFNSTLADLLKLPVDKKMRIAEVNDYLEENIGTLVQLLKEAGQYRIDAEEIDVSEEETFDGDETEETSEFENIEGTAEDE